MRILLWRHGRTEWNDTGRLQGWADPPLDDVGRLQAQVTAPLIAALSPALIVSSDLVRAADTAAALGLPVRLDPRLREVDVGDWSGLSATEAASRFPELDAAWRRGEDVRRGGGETYREVAARAVQVIDEVASSGEVTGDGLLVLVLHGGTARALIGRLSELPHESWWRFGPLGNCRWSLLREDVRGFRLMEHNVGAQIPAEGGGAFPGAAPAPGTATPSPDVEPVQ